MSSNGIQPDAPHELQYFHPVLREYYQSIRDAALHDTFSTTQESLAPKKLDQAPLAEQSAAPATALGQSSEDVTATLGGNEVPVSSQTIEPLPQEVQSLSVGPSTQLDPAANGAIAPAAATGNSEVGANLDVRV
jgi:hypothetical protein